MKANIDHNSAKNQDIKGKLVGREVYCNVNSLVEYCLKMGYEDRESPVNSDDIENLYTYPEYIGEYTSFPGGTEEQRDAEIERLKELMDLMQEDTINENDERMELISNDIEALESLENEPQEVYEWWAVSNWFYEKLKAKGEVVCDAGSCYVWGRCTTGQAILLDGVISEIAEDMEILEGQSNDWSK